MVRPLGAEMQVDRAGKIDATHPREELANPADGAGSVDRPGAGGPRARCGAGARAPSLVASTVTTTVARRTAWAARARELDGAHPLDRVGTDRSSPPDAAERLVLPTQPATVTIVRSRSTGVRRSFTTWTSRVTRSLASHRSGRRRAPRSPARTPRRTPPRPAWPCARGRAGPPSPRVPGRPMAKAAKPPVGRYLRRRSVSIVVAHEPRPGGPGRRLSSRRASRGARGHLPTDRAELRGRSGRRARSQSRSGQRSAASPSRSSRAPSPPGACAPNSATKRPRRGHHRRSRARSQVATVMPAGPEVGRGARRAGAGGATRRCGPAPGGSGRTWRGSRPPSGRAWSGSRTGSAWAASHRRAGGPNGSGRSSVRHVRGVDAAMGSLCAHQTSSDGWWASSSTAWRARRRADALAWRCSAHWIGEVLPEQHTLAVGLVVELGPGDVAVDAHEVEPGVGRPSDVGGDLLGRRLGQQLAGGADRHALEEEALAVDRGDEVVHADLAEARAPLVAVAHLVVDHHVDTDVVERLVARGPGATTARDRAPAP